MTDQTPAKTGESRNDGRWQKGQSGNPRGKPKGWRSAVATLLDAAAMEDAPAVYAAIRAAATGGDMRAADILMSRWWPLIKRTSLDLAEMPEIRTARDALDAATHIMACAARNEISAEQADIAMRLIETARKTIETADLAERLAALEDRAREQ